MKVTNLIIGAGPAGLAMAGQFRNSNIDFEIIEKTDRIAPKWHAHYDRLHLHTVRGLSHLPHLAFPENYPQYVYKDQLIVYYEDYIQKFNIKPHFNTEVKSISKNGHNWEVECIGKNFEAQNVIIASGLNRVPKVPNFKGQELFKGKIIHASEYKNAIPYQGHRVLVIGMGNTGAEIALDLAENNIENAISVRSPLVIVPRDIFGNPVQLTALKLEKLPFGIGDWLGNVTRKMVLGDLSKYGLPISDQKPAELLRTTGKTPTIDLGTIAKIKTGDIKIYPDIAEIIEEGVTFVNGETVKFDSIILATGYYSRIDNFLNASESILDELGEPKEKIGKAENEGLYFIGFDKYKLGGILGTLKKDSEDILKSILDKIS